MTPTNKDPLFFEKQEWEKHRFLVGIDEAGRGAWAGPVVAAAVVFDPHFFLEGVKDSKLISPQKRETLFTGICKNAVSYGVGIVDSVTIDTVNILEATKQAMLMAVSQLQIEPDCLLIDGNITLATKFKQRAIIDGDDLSFTIAAASILAKVTRDRLMRSYSQAYPEYGFEKHKGYGTKIHREALKSRGCTPIHRKSYAPVADFLPQRDSSH